MIKINLLGLKRKKKRKPVPTFIILMITFMLLSLVGHSYWIYHLNSQIAGLKEERSNNEKRIVRLKERIKEVENFEKLNKTFEDRKNIIEQLRKNQSMPVRVLDELSSLLPNGVWLSTMSISDDKIDMEGSGFTNDDVVAFVDNLKKSSSFVEIYLAETRQALQESVSLYQFKISMKVKAT